MGGNDTVNCVLQVTLIFHIEVIETVQLNFSTIS